MIDGLGHHGGLQARNGGNRYGLARCGLDVVVHELVRSEPFALLHLRDHLVGTAGHAEVVDIAPAQHGGQRSRRHPPWSGPSAPALSRSNSSMVCGLSILRSVSTIHEHAACMGLFHKGLGNLIEPLEGVGGADDKLHRQAMARARAEAAAETPRLGAGDLAELVLNLRLQMPWSCGSAHPTVLSTRPAKPELRPKNPSTWKRCVDFRVSAHRSVARLLRVELRLLEGGIRGSREHGHA